MTATPIPRTMTLTVYGDLDVSLIRELPPGRKPIRTFVRRPDRRPLIYRYVHSQLEEGRQAYVVCPLIEMDEESKLPSAEEIYDELRYGIFQDMPCGLVHGRMRPADKEAVMEAFYQGDIKLLSRRRLSRSVSMCRMRASWSWSMPTASAFRSSISCAGASAAALTPRTASLFQRARRSSA